MAMKKENLGNSISFFSGAHIVTGRLSDSDVPLEPIDHGDQSPFYNMTNFSRWAYSVSRMGTAPE
ncbi:uncharacterized protein N7479_006179 [Penicillium vulpinum]|uniref:uncharacterized protein n=1 Tax=Penicillium vulpinum TaxID=29845 RepID=UPI0025469AB2|nr:uncharacterized protein N7479_006179 [Penicillium vulpinum]KAJ5959029.1 hypothetical protein N7479_006179 [Penicillium vulpinum]